MSKKKRYVKKFNKSIIAILVVPFISIIMHGNFIEYSEKIRALHVTEGNGYYDIFSYWKMILIIAVAAVMILSIILNSEKYTLKKDKNLFKLYLPMVIYIFFVLVSSIFSKFPEFAYIGMYERYEGGLVILSYIIFVYFITQNIKDEIDLKYIINALLISSSIIIFIAFLQGLGVDILMSNTVLNLIGLGNIGNVNATFEKGWAYSTLYNPNYLGQYTVLLLPILTGIFQYISSKKMKIFTAILIGLDFLALIFAKTSTAYLAVIASIVFVIAINIKKIWDKKILKILFITLISFTIIISVAVFSGAFGQETINYINNRSGVDYIEEGDVYIENIIIESHVAKITTNEYTINMHIDNAKKEKTFYIYFTNENEEILETVIENYVIRFTDERFKELFYGKIFRDGFIDFIIREPNSHIHSTTRFLYTFDEGIMGVVGPDKSLIKDIKPTNMPKWLIGNEKMFSRRLYIWAVTAKNLKNNLFIGDGPDTFRVVFDQSDVIGKVNMMHQSYIVVDKPHNLYLQIAQGSGLISLFAYLVLMISYLVWSIKLYFNINFKEKLHMLGMFISMGIVGYLTAGIFIDSNVSVAPTFYFIFGMGITVNLMVSKKKPRIKNK